MWVWLAAVVVVSIIVISALQLRGKRGHYRPLASRQPGRHSPEDQRELGMEAIDMDAVSRVNKRNESLERSHSIWRQGKKGPGNENADTFVAPLSDDETYAQRYHAAFGKKKSKDK